MTTDAIDPFAGLTTVATLPAPPANPPSKKQLAFLRSLAEERDVDLEEIIPTLDKRGASSWIDKLLAQPKAARIVEMTDAPEGIHFTEGTVYKVQFNREKTQKYAKRLSSGGDFVYEGKAPLRFLNEGTLMSLEQAKEYGQLYGMCCRCGATLTLEASIAAGIGPICGSKF